MKNISILKISKIEDTFRCNAGAYSETLLAGQAGNKYTRVFVLHIVDLILKSKIINKLMIVNINKTDV